MLEKNKMAAKRWGKQKTVRNLLFYIYVHSVSVTRGGRDSMIPSPKNNFCLRKNIPKFVTNTLQDTKSKIVNTNFRKYYVA